MSLCSQKALDVVNSNDKARRKLAEEIDVLYISPPFGDLFYIKFPLIVPSELHLERIKEIALMVAPSKVIVRQSHRYGKDITEHIGPHTTLTVDYSEYLRDEHDVPKADEPEHYKFVVGEAPKGRYGSVDIYVPISTRRDNKMVEKPRWNLFGHSFGRIYQQVEETLTDYSRVFVMLFDEDGTIALKTAYATHTRIDAMQTMLEERLFGVHEEAHRRLGTVA